MRCPSCKKNVSEYAAECPHCGYGLSAYQAFNTMKDELGNISVETDSLSQRIRQMQKRLSQFESLFSQQVSEEEKTPDRVAGVKTQPKVPVSEDTTEAVARQQVRRQPPPAAPPSGWR